MTEFRDIWLHAHHMIRSARQIINKDLQPLNLSSAEGNILLHLLMHDQGIGQEQLAEHLDISKPAVSRALDSLEKKGFITREPDSEDRRVHRICLTDHARDTSPAVERAFNQLYVLATQGISQEELDYFLNLFSRMSENFLRAQDK